MADVPLAAIKQALGSLAVLVTLQPWPPLLDGVLCLCITLDPAAGGPGGPVHAALGAGLSCFLFFFLLPILFAAA